MADPHTINPDFRPRRKPQYSATEYVRGILAGDVLLLSQAITLIESEQPRHQVIAADIVSQCLQHGAADTIRVGITGTPGVGKSTFIEALGMYLIERGYRVAVLAVDPSSSVTQGSILGDKTRMVRLSMQPKAFIRPSAAGSSLGGVARKTRESIVLCEAAGFEVVLVETVGVGQSETAVHQMTDFFLLLLQPGAGDELQGIKRGIVEMADLVAFNKADGPQAAMAQVARRQYQNALHLLPPQPSGWVPQAVTCSALTGEGVGDIWELVLRYQTWCQQRDVWHARRQQQALAWLHDHLRQHWIGQLYCHPAVAELLPDVERQVAAGQLSPFAAADVLLARLR